jgi:hypothetical protein
MKDSRMKYIKLFEEHSLFPNSKVVDNRGKLIKVYHGGSYSSGEFLGTAWFTTTKADARYYAEQIDGTLTTAYLNIENPLYTNNSNITIDENVEQVFKNRGLEYYLENSKDGVINNIEPNTAVIIAKDLGYDGVIDTYNDKIIDCVVWNSSQIEILDVK